MNRDATLLAVIGVIVLTVVIVAGLGAIGTTRSTTTSGTPIAISEPPADGTTGSIFELRKTGGHRMFGITFHAPAYEVYVGMVVPDHCLSRDASGTESLLTDGECAGLPAQGELTGSGTTPSGRSLAVVRIDISPACYDALTVGDTWPSAAQPCRE